MKTKGKLIISLDFELMWGMAGHSMNYIKAYRPNIENAISALKRILEILEEFHIKVTIAHVGSMCFSDLDEFRSFQKTIDKKPDYANRNYSAYQLCMNSEEQLLSPPISDLFFCRSFLHQLANNSNVELASHTFSHYYCLEKGQTVEQFNEDLALAEKMSLKKYTSIIFPRNQVSESYLSICKQRGFTHYRSIMEDFVHKTEETKSHFSIKGALRLLDTYLPITGYKTFGQSIDHNGIKEVPGSMFLRPWSKHLKMLEPLKLWRIKRSMAHAAKQGEVFHLWWHPHNFGAHTEENLMTLRLICKHYEHLHNKYGMESIFMKEL